MESVDMRAPKVRAAMPRGSRKKATKKRVARKSARDLHEHDSAVLSSLVAYLMRRELREFRELQAQESIASSLRIIAENLSDESTKARVAQLLTSGEQRAGEAVQVSEEG
jgi:hypothetical protein